MTYIRFLCVCVQFWAPCQSYVKLQLTKEVMLVSNTKFSSVIWYKGSAYTLHCHQKVCDFRRRICPLWVWRDLYVHANCTKGSLVTKPPWKRFDVNVIVWIFIIVAGICFLFVCVCLKNVASVVSPCIQYSSECEWQNGVVTMDRGLGDLFLVSLCYANPNLLFFSCGAVM